jgi:hypothetical protein
MNTYKISLGGNIVEYRCFIGNSKIVYLKATMATYLEFGRRLHTSYGCSVICVLGFGSPNTDKRIIDDFIKRHKIMDAEMFYISHAKGCFDGLELAGGGVSFKKMVLVNMPLDEKFDNVLAQLKVIPETKIVAIFAEKDRSFECVPLLKEKGLLNVEIFLSRDIYHSRKIAIDTFKELE